MLDAGSPSADRHPDIPRIPPPADATPPIAPLNPAAPVHDGESLAHVEPSAESLSRPFLSASVEPPPVAKKIPHITAIHGDVLVDNYHWMRNRADPDVFKHLDAENRHTNAVMAPTLPLQEKLYQEALS